MMKENFDLNSKNLELKIEIDNLKNELISLKQNNNDLKNNMLEKQKLEKSNSKNEVF